MAIYYDTPLDRTFHALGDPTRRRMIGALASEGAQTASQLGDPFDISQPSVSKHIKVLETAGLLVRKIEGRVHSFTLNSAPLEEADAWINRHKAFWQGSLAQLDTLVEEINEGNDSD
jgi:DNA-binding transcriptional ArsR family regulator